MMIESTGQKVLKVLLYVFLIITAAIMLLPFLWMLSASLKQDKRILNGRTTAGYGRRSRF